MSREAMKLTQDVIPATTYSIYQPPKPVGAWVLYDQGAWKTKFLMYHKPTDEQIKNTEELLGWKWEEQS